METESRKRTCRRDLQGSPHKINTQANNVMGKVQSQKSEKQKERGRDQKTGDVERDGDTGDADGGGGDQERNRFQSRCAALRRKSEDIATAWL